MMLINRFLISIFLMGIGAVAYADCQYSNGQWTAEGTVAGNQICRGGQWVQNLPPPPPPPPPPQGCFYSNGQFAPEGTVASNGQMICRNSQWVAVNTTPNNPLPGGRWTAQGSGDDVSFEAVNFDSNSGQFSGTMTQYRSNGAVITFIYTYRPINQTEGVLTINGADGVITLRTETFSYTNMTVKNGQGSLTWFRS